MYLKEKSYLLSTIFDTYVLRYKLGIEVDEYDHEGRNSNYEKSRQFCRTNPDAADFDMNRLINQLYTQIIKNMKNTQSKIKRIKTKSNLGQRIVEGVKITLIILGRKKWKWKAKWLEKNLTVSSVDQIIQGFQNKGAAAKNRKIKMCWVFMKLKMNVTWKAN